MAFTGILFDSTGRQSNQGTSPTPHDNWPVSSSRGVEDASGNGTFDWAVIKAAPLNVQSAEFGAKGDGITDDTAAFQAALAVQASHAQSDTVQSLEVFVPPGTYIVNDLQLAYSGQTIRGAGFGTTLKAAPGATAAVHIEGKRRCKLTNLSIDGNGKNSIGVRIASDGAISSEQNELDRVRITNCSVALDVNHPVETTSTGSQTLPIGTFNVASTTGFPATNSSFTVNDGTKTAIVNYTGTTATSFTGCTGGTGTFGAGSQVVPNGATPVNQADKNTYINSQFVASTTLVRIDAINAQEQAFYGCTFDGPGVTTGIDLRNGSFTAIGSQFQTAGTTAIKLGGINIQWVKLTDCIFEGHTADIDGTYYWPLAGVGVDSCVFSGTAACIRTGGGVSSLNPTLRASACTFNTGLVGGAATTLDYLDLHNIYANGAAYSSGAGSRRFLWAPGDQPRLYGSNVSLEGGTVYFDDAGTAAILGGGGAVACFGNLRVYSAGTGVRVAEGANCKQGIATLAAGTVTVANTSITAASRILLTRQDGGANPGAPYVSARVAGTSFTIASTNAGDTGSVAYQIFEPA